MIEINEQVVETVRRFLRTAPAGNHYLLGRVRNGVVKTAIQTEVEFFDPRRVVFFTDSVPDANWAHHCLYWSVGETAEEAECIDDEWPPSEDVPMLRIVKTAAGFEIVPP